MEIINNNNVIKCRKCGRSLQDIISNCESFQISSYEEFICEDCKKYEELDSQKEMWKKLFQVDEKDKKIKILEKALRNLSHELSIYEEENTGEWARTEEMIYYEAIADVENFDKEIKDGNKNEEI